MIHDRDIREPLFDFLEERYGKIRILEEKTMGRSRADIVMVTEDAIVGIEIKSDADTYARLARQVRDYDKYYDYNIVAVGSTHGAHIGEHVPDHWGIITVEIEDDVPDFYVLREPRANPKLDPSRKMEILWRNELARLQEMNEMPKYRDKSKEFVVGKLLERVPDRIAPDVLNRQISDILFERDYTTAEETLREYRKSDLRKQIEAETDGSRKLELMMELASKKPPRRKRRRR